MDANRTNEDKAGWMQVLSTGQNIHLGAHLNHVTVQNIRSCKLHDGGFFGVSKSKSESGGARECHHLKEEFLKE